MFYIIYRIKYKLLIHIKEYNQIFILQDIIMLNPNPIFILENEKMLR